MSQRVLPTDEGLWWARWGQSQPKIWTVRRLKTGRLYVPITDESPSPVDDEHWEWLTRVLGPFESGPLLQKVSMLEQEIRDYLATIRDLRAEATTLRATIRDLRHEMRTTTSPES